MHHKKAVFVVVNACSSKDYTNNIVGVCFVGQDVTGLKVVMDTYYHLKLIWEGSKDWDYAQ